MNLSDSLSPHAIHPAVADLKRQTWALLLAGLLIGFIGMQVIVVRPMKRQVDALRESVAAVKGDVQQLVGVRDQPWTTNNLLNGLKSQQAQLETARAALAEIGRFRTDLEAEAGRTMDAVAVITRFAELQQQLLDRRDDVPEARITLDDLLTLQTDLLQSREDGEKAAGVFGEMASLQQRLIEQGDASVCADEAANDIAAMQARVIEQGRAARDGQASLDAVAAMQERLSEQRPATAAADAAIDALFDVRNRLIAENATTGEADEAVSRLTSLKRSVVEEAADADSADAALAGLGEMKRNLIAQTDGLDTARKNLDSLLEMHSKLADSTENFIASVQALELLSDFSAELRTQIQSLDGIRRSLVDIALLETSVGRAVRVLEPLSQIANLRRLGESEVRDAARLILEQRNTRIGSAEKAQLPLRPIDQPAEEAVPAPIDAEIPAK